MTLKTVFFTLLAGGVLVWLVYLAPFINETWKRYISYAIAAFVILWLIAQSGLFDYLDKVRI